MPAHMSIVQDVLASNKFEVHEHRTWIDAEAGTKGVSPAAAAALRAHRAVFSKLRIDDQCPICFDSLCEGSPVCGKNPHDAFRIEPVEQNMPLSPIGGAEEAAVTGAVAEAGNEAMLAEAKEAMVLPCGHSFHGSCGREWFLRSKCCPSCRFELTEASVNGAARRCAQALLEACDHPKSWLTAEATKAGAEAQRAAFARRSIGDDEDSDSEPEVEPLDVPSAPRRRFFSLWPRRLSVSPLPPQDIDHGGSTNSAASAASSGGGGSASDGGNHGGSGAGGGGGGGTRELSEGMGDRGSTSTARRVSTFARALALFAPRSVHERG